MRKGREGHQPHRRHLAPGEALVSATKSFLARFARAARYRDHAQKGALPYRPHRRLRVPLPILRVLRVLRVKAFSFFVSPSHRLCGEPNP